MNTHQTVMVQPKPALTSRRTWVNLITGLVGAIGVAIEIIPQVEVVFDVPDIVPSVLLMLAAVGNIVLNSISTQPVRFRRESMKDGVAVKAA